MLWSITKLQTCSVLKINTFFSYLYLKCKYLEENMNLKYMFKLSLFLSFIYFFFLQLYSSKCPKFFYCLFSKIHGWKVKLITQLNYLHKQGFVPTQPHIDATLGLYTVKFKMRQTPKVLASYVILTANTIMCT